jgi:hypothetical protein
LYWFVVPNLSSKSCWKKALGKVYLNGFNPTQIRGCSDIQWYTVLWQCLLFSSRRLQWLDRWVTLVFGPGFEPLQRTKFVRNWSPYIDKHQLCFFLKFYYYCSFLHWEASFLRNVFDWNCLSYTLYSVALQCVVFYIKSFLFKNWKRNYCRRNKPPLLGVLLYWTYDYYRKC